MTPPVEEHFPLIYRFLPLRRSTRRSTVANEEVVRSSRRKGGNGAGGITRRPNGLWMGRITLGYENGRQVRRAYYGPTAAEVRAKMAEAQAKLQTGATPVTRGRGATLAGYVREVYLPGAEHRLGPRTLLRYRELLEQHVLPTLGTKQIAKLQPGDVEALLSAKLKEPARGGVLSPGTVGHIRTALRAVLNRAIRDGLAVRNAASLASPPRVGRRELSLLKRDELQLLLESAEAHRDGPFWILLLTTGCRTGEALALRWSDINEEARTMSIGRTLHRLDGTYQLLDTKTRLSRRTVPLTELGLGALRRQKALQAKERLATKSWDGSWDGLVFRSPRGLPLNGSLLTHRFQEHLASIGLPAKFRLHDCRHQAASMLVAAGLPVREVQAVLGHASPTTTLAIYGHLVEGGQRAVAETMQQLLTFSESAGES